MKDKLKLSLSDIETSHSKDFIYGDYTSNIAMSLYRMLAFALDSHVSGGKKSGVIWVPIPGKNWRSPIELAEEIKNKILSEDMIDRIEVVKPGFINFYLNKNYLLSELDRIVKEEKEYGKLKLWQGQKIVVEYTDPNPFKEFHIGHLYSNTVGESLTRLFESMGAEVKRADYFGDVGMHVAKSLWGLRQKMSRENTQLATLKVKTLKERIKYLGQAYAKGATAYEEDNKAKNEIKNINYLVYISAQNYMREKYNWEPQVNYKKYVQYKESELKEISEFYQIGREWSLSYFEEIYQRLGTKFDFYYPESISGEYGFKVVKEFAKVFQKSEGAIIFDGEKYGLHKRVFINSLGLPTYEAKELGLSIKKYEDYQYDKSVIVTGNEINEYFKVLLKVLGEIKADLAKKTTHIGHGMVRLPEGKMSSRTGKIKTGEWLIEEGKLKALELINSDEFTDTDKEKLGEIVGIGAVKYALLKHGVGHDIEFDFKTSVSLEGNSGPYLQYTYARTRSVLRKVKDYKSKVLINKLELNDQEISILRTIYKFSEVVTDSAESYSPNLICNFLFDLAQKYNSFYNDYPIIKSDKDIKQFRLLLTVAVSQIIKNGLYLLGIKVPERM